MSLLIHMHVAFAVEAQALKVSRLGDTEMQCGQISQEAALMRDIVMTTQDIKDTTKIKNHGITAAGAVGSFLVGSVTGGVGIAAAGLLLKNVTADTQKEADGIQDLAEQRRSLMIGIYNAKGCLGPIDHVLQDEVNAPAPEIKVALIEPESGDSEEEQKTPRYNQ